MRLCDGRRLARRDPPSPSGGGGGGGGTRFWHPNHCDGLRCHRGRHCRRRRRQLCLRCSGSQIATNFCSAAAITSPVPPSSALERGGSNNKGPAGLASCAKWPRTGICVRAAGLCGESLN